MIVKIGDQVYSDKDVIILLVVDESDKQNFVQLLNEDSNKVVFYPDDKVSENEAIEFMKSYDGGL